MATSSLLPSAQPVNVTESRIEAGCASSPGQTAPALECAWGGVPGSSIDRLGSGVPPWMVGSDHSLFSKRDLV